MDQGNFLTDSGSKIPKPKSKDIVLKVPKKPQLVATSVSRTEYVNLQDAKPSTNLSKLRTIGKSVPNIAKAGSLVRSKTNFSRCPTTSSAAKAVSSTTSVAVKRQASNDEDPPTNAKVAKTGFPYKAKSWELKLRLAECEQWLTDARLKTTELEEVVESNAQELEESRNVKQLLEKEVTKSYTFETDLKSKTSDYDKLHYDSKQFLDKIQNLECDVSKKQNELTILQTDLTKLRDESITSAAEISKLKFSCDDLEFKFRRQTNSLENIENLYNGSQAELSKLQSKLRETDCQLSETEIKLERSERDNRAKENIIKDLESDLLTAKSKISDLEKNISRTNDNNENLAAQLASIKEELSNCQQNLIDRTANFEEMKTKLCDSEKYRRYLHNLVQDLKGNIRVFCRVRPPLPAEKENSILCNISYPDEGTIEISKADPFDNINNQVASRPKFQKHEYSFDKVFNPGSSQTVVFDELSQLVQSALDGFNVCIFAYGQTGSGKTYTMEGSSNTEARGMIPRTVQHIFTRVADLELIGWTYTVEVCFIEIYNEIIRDLLRSDKDGNNLKIMQVDGKTNDVVIPGLTVMKVNSYEDLDRLYVLAHQNRAVAATSCNERSSRSHSVTKIKVTGVHKERGETCYGSLNLVDLAGSERLTESASANDPRLREMKNINKSLSELGNVILGLYQKNEHIPYRNSKLTHLLQPALGGSSKTLMLVNISPVESCMSETLCSLRFAQKVNQVKVATSKKRITYDAVAK